MSHDRFAALERFEPLFEAPEPSFEGFLRRRERKRRNQRITAGFAGFAVFVAAVLIVTTIGPFDRTQAPVPGGDVTGPAVTGPTGTGPSQTGPATTGPTVTGPTQAVGPVPETDYVLDLNTGEVTPLPESIVGEEKNDRTGGYAASPDGSMLAYTAPDNGRSGQIFVANLDGAEIEQVTDDLEAASSPVWSPDGSKIAYTGHQGGEPDNLFVLDVATGASTQVTFETWKPGTATPNNTWPGGYGWRASEPSFTPDGSSIVYGAIRWAADGSSAEYETRMIPVTGGDYVRLMGGQGDGPDAISSAILSPDGSLLLYSCSGYSALCVANADGTDAREVVQSFDAVGSGGWSPDGTRIAYSQFHAQDVHIMDVVTGRVTYVAEGFGEIWLNDHTLIVEISGCYDHATGAWSRECPG